MNWTKWVRQTHRWLSIVFTLAVIVNGVMVLRGKYSPKLGLVAVFPLGFLLVTGLYLFVLPYVAKWRGGQRASRTGGQPHDNFKLARSRSDS